MLDQLPSDLITSAIAVARDLLGNRLIKKNNELLERKRRQEQTSKTLTAAQVQSLALEPKEVLKADFRCHASDPLIPLRAHLADVERWSSRVSFMDMRGSKGLSSIYVELDTYLMPLRTHFNDNERERLRPLPVAVFGSNSHCVVLGQPGAGKTTSMKRLCARFFEHEGLHGFSFPVLINLRDLEATNDNSSIQKQLKQVFPFELVANESARHALDEGQRGSMATTLFMSSLDSLKALVILEGFDEIQTADRKDSALKEIRHLSGLLKRTKLIVTCRTGEFHFNLDHCEVFEISSLSDQQISTFAQKWIGPERARGFLADMRTSPFWDTAIKPLSLAHLCAIYERIGSIPDRPKTVYRKVVGLLIEEWDEQRSIKRSSQYSNFEPDRKFEFLTHLSFHLTVTGRTTVFTQEQLIEAYLAICPNFKLPESQSGKVAAEIESHTGLFVQTGYKKYEFAHKSLQEFLTAEYIVKLPSIDLIERYIDRLGAELAVAVSISSNPSLYLSELVLRVLNRTEPSSAFYDALIARIVQERPDFYACDEIVLAALSLLNNHKSHHMILQLISGVLSANDIRVVLKYYRVAERTKDLVTLHRKKMTSQYKLKSTLSLPTAYFGDLQ